jgi:hypothetical protein
MTCIETFYGSDGKKRSKRSFTFGHIFPKRSIIQKFWNIFLVNKGYIVIIPRRFILYFG